MPCCPKIGPAFSAVKTSLDTVKRFSEIARANLLRIDSTFWLSPSNQYPDQPLSSRSGIVLAAISGAELYEHSVGRTNAEQNFSDDSIFAILGEYLAFVPIQSFGIVVSGAGQQRSHEKLLA